MDKTFGIVGLGLIGGSIGLSLKGKVNKVIGLDIDDETLEAALSSGAIDYGTKDPKDLVEADFIIVALYPEATMDFILNHQYLWREGQLIMDVGGLKEHVVSTIQSQLSRKIEFLGAHPMAGREEKGFKMAKEELFLGSTLILTPTALNSSEKIGWAQNLGSLLGVRAVYELEPATHDQVVAYTSHLSHIMACAYIHNFFEPSEKMMGGSFRDATRVAKINEFLWTELFMNNREQNLKEVNRLLSTLEVLKGYLETKDEKAMESFLKEARKIKEGLDQ